MKLNKPDFVSNIREIQELDKALTPELDELNHTIQQIQQNQFIETANHQGLSYYERMLKIKPDKDMEVRRFNILAKFNSTIPFTMRWLQNTLNSTIGKGSYLLDLNHANYTLTISIMKHKEYLITHLRQEVEDKLPAHLILVINVLSPINLSHYVGAYIQTSDIIEN
ncbi:MAG: putative phage tail protein [Zhenhengia sp.]|jgi:hypothetical protein|uniref:putative phage tail protein n=1 Tax=Zhenhengia sp. TaxID=2944208 RepID=UPI0029154616|nr:putative phage tail protein [Clostridiales bacterium]MDU6974332.1 putative phage tail protein [Clostridiales bacterium]